MHPPTLTLLLTLLLLLTTSTLTLVIDIPSPLIYTAIGSISGATGALAVYPIDFIKSNLQSSSGRAQYTSGFDACYQIVSQYGPLALYKGCPVQVLGTAPEKTIKLAINDAARSSLAAAMGGTCPLWGEILAGACAGCGQVVVSNPLEVIKVKLQTSPLINSSSSSSSSSSNEETLLSSLSDVFREIGEPFNGNYVRGLYQGAQACILRDMSFSAILFPTYAHAKVFLPHLLGLETTTGGALIDILAGGIAAAPAAFLVTPADLVKTRIQQRKSQDGGSTDETTTTTKVSGMNVWEAANTIYQREGIQVFWSGGVERMVRSVPQFAVTLAVFDVLKTAAIQNGVLS